MEKIEKKEFLEKKLAEGCPADKMKLAAEDLEYGLPTAQIEIYLDKEYSMRQARLMSDCMRDEKLTGLLIVIQHQNVFRMELAKKYLKLGVPLMAIDEAVRETTDAYTMGKMLAKVYLDKEEADREARIRELYEAAEKVEAIRAGKNKATEEKDHAEGKKTVVGEKSQATADTDGTAEPVETENSEENRRGDKVSGEQPKESEEKPEKKTSTEVEQNADKAANEENAAVVGKKQERIGGIEYMLNTVGGIIPIEVMSVDGTDHRTLSFATLLRTKNHPRRDIFKVIAKKKLSVEQMEQISLGVEAGLSDRQIKLILSQDRTPEEIAELVKTAVDLNHRPLV